MEDHKVKCLELHVDVLNELTQKYSLGYMAQPRSDAIFHLRLFICL